MARPGGSSVGMSFIEWTARSIAPAISASSISLVKRPFVDCCAPSRDSGTSVILSPVVWMISTRLSISRSASRAWM
jgi:hypothetical protein